MFMFGKHEVQVSVKDKKLFDLTGCYNMFNCLVCYYLLNARGNFKKSGTKSYSYFMKLGSEVVIHLSILLVIRSVTDVLWAQSRFVKFVFGGGGG